MIKSKYTKEILQIEAIKYHTRYQFKLESPNYYEAARRLNFLNDICLHMLPIKCSIPQKICKQLFDIVLNEVGLYNDRKTISPLELDIFYPIQKIAIEFQGQYWHKMKNVAKNDAIKEKKCLEHNIRLIKIHESKKSHDEQTINIKNQIKKLNFPITETEIDNISIDKQKLYEDFSENKIKETISKYSTIFEFSNKNKGLYMMLRRSHLAYLLDPLRQRVININWKTMTDEDIINYIKRFCVSYSEAYEIPKFQTILRRRKLKEKFKSSQ